MQCKCKYFMMKDGVRVCSVCGKPAHSSKIEDKVVTQHETKTIYPPESKRLKKGKRK